MTTTPLMPAAFIGHGIPMNAIMENRYTRSWRELGTALPRPRAVLVISAHWYIMHSLVTAMPYPRTVHDTWPFPPLRTVEYPAPGAPDVAELVAEIAKPQITSLDDDTWGLDHGTWSVLTHMFPEADVPVVQLSVDSRMSLEQHFELGARLAPLREQGVIVVGSGNIVHNLAAADPSKPDHGHDWAHRFDEAARERLTATPDGVLGLQGTRDFDVAVPTPDHFIPMLYLAGLSAASGSKADVLVDGYAFSTMSMTSYTLGLDTTPSQDRSTP